MAQSFTTEQDTTCQQTIKDLSASSLSLPDAAEVATLLQKLRMEDDGKPYGTEVSSKVGNFTPIVPELKR